MKARRLRLFSLLALLGIVAAACSSARANDAVSGPGWVNGVPPSAGSSVDSSRPNIIFVLTDDLSWNLVPYMPNVVSMENEGVTFSNYFVTDSLCCPSRTSIFTGEFPHNSGVLNNLGPQGGFQAFLRNGDENHTFVSQLAAQGYQTGMFGKYLNKYEPTDTYLHQRPYVPPGWSAWDVAGLHGYRELNYSLAVGRQVGNYGGAPSDYLTSVLSTKASQFIAASARAHRPFMAEIATYAPHAPYVPAPQDAAKFPGLRAPRDAAFGHAVTNAPKWLKAIPPLPPKAKARLDRIYRLRVQDVQSVDRLLGRLRAEIQSLGIADNTYVVFSSDNGLHLGEYNLRQGKSTAFDTDTRVPLVVTGPGIPPATRSTLLTSNVDLAPTFDTLAGTTPPATVNGRSLLPLLHGMSPPDWRSAVLVEHQGPDVSPSDPDYPVRYSGNPPTYQAIRTAHYLYVEYVDGERDFFNLRTDPAELHNRYASMPIWLKQQLHTTLLRMHTCHGAGACWAAQHIVPVPPRHHTSGSARKASPPR